MLQNELVTVQRRIKKYIERLKNIHYCLRKLILDVARLLNNNITQQQNVTQNYY